MNNELTMIYSALTNKTQSYNDGDCIPCFCLLNQNKHSKTLHNICLFCVIDVCNNTKSRGILNLLKSSNWFEDSMCTRCKKINIITIRNIPFCLNH